MPAPGKIHTRRSRIRRALKIGPSTTNVEILYPRMAARIGGKLKSNEDEDQSIQNEIQGLPDGPDLEANRGREEIGAAARQKQSARDNRQHARRVNCICGQINGVRDQNAQGDLDRAIIDPPLDLVDDPADDQAQPDAAGSQPGKSQDSAR